MRSQNKIFAKLETWKTSVKLSQKPALFFEDKLKQIIIRFHLFGFLKTKVHEFHICNY